MSSRLWCVLLVGATSAVGCVDEPSVISPYEFAPSVVPTPIAPADVDALVAQVVRPGEIATDTSVQSLRGIGESVVFTVLGGGDDVRAVAIGRDGVAHDPADVLQRDAIARRAAFGRMAPELFEHQAKLAPDETLAVVLQFDGDFEEPDFGELSKLAKDRQITQQDINEYVGALRERQRGNIARAAQPVLRLLEDVGATVVTSYKSLPFIEARLEVRALRSANLNMAPQILKLQAATSETEKQAAEPLGYAGQGSWKDGVNPSLTGCGGPSTPCDGGDLTVGLWEQTRWFSKTGRIASTHSRFDSATPPVYQSPASACPCDAAHQKCAAGTCVMEHTSWVAASLGMKGTFTYSKDHPNAPTSVTFPSSGAWKVHFAVSTTGDMTGLDWFLNESAVVFLNRSMTVFAHDYADAVNWAARYQLLVFTHSSGNVANAAVVCGSLWDGICVGNYAYQTYDNAATHVRYPSSSYLDPPAFNNFPSGVERPHLMGPGAWQATRGLVMPEITSTSAMTSLDIGSSEIVGTSFASPAVLGVAVQVVQHEGFGALVPHLLKSILMAGTVDSNADGQVGTSSTWSITGDFEDGAGHPDHRYINQIVDNDQYRVLTFHDADFASCGTNCREYSVATVSFPPLRTAIKANLSWLSCSLTSNAQGNLVNDLDLRISDCHGSSSSIFSEVEEVYFPLSTCTSSTVTIKVRIKNGAALNGCGSSTAQPAAVSWSFQ